MSKIEFVAAQVRKLHEKIRRDVISACESESVAHLSEIAYEAEEDTIYSIDKVSEDLLVASFQTDVAPSTPVVLIAEGVSGGKIVLPEGSAEEEAVFRVIMDPIDGTRGLMYQKRSAWILTGIAPNKGEATNLQDIVFAIQTEIPLVKQHLSDVIWAHRGSGAHAERFNRLAEEYQPLRLCPSQADSVEHGYAMISRFFPGAREVLAEIDEEIIRAALGEVKPGKAHCFEDQYVCTGGQLAELLNGHDRFIADLRPLMEKVLQRRGLSLGLCCHPYDICTELIARELGVSITDPYGKPLSVPLNVHDDVSWIGYANERIRAEIEPHLRHALQKRDLL